MPVCQAGLNSCQVGLLSAPLPPTPRLAPIMMLQINITMRGGSDASLPELPRHSDPAETGLMHKCTTMFGAKCLIFSLFFLVGFLFTPSNACRSSLEQPHDRLRGGES